MHLLNEPQKYIVEFDPKTAARASPSATGTAGPAGQPFGCRDLGPIEGRGGGWAVWAAGLRAAADGGPWGDSYKYVVMGASHFAWT